jgi:gluconolactonase
MTILKYTLPALCLLAAPAFAQNAMKADIMRVVRVDPALDAVITPGTRVGRVAGGFGFVEGPVWKNGRLYFSDVVDNNIRALDGMGNVVVVLKASGGLTNPPKGSNAGSNGLITDKDGTILVTRMGIGTIERLDEKGGLKPLLSKYDGKRLSSPNDLVFAKDGALWFTDPSFGLPKMDADPKKETKFNGVYRYAGGKLTAMITDMVQPNGLGFSPDGKTLYVSNSMPDMVLRAYDVGTDGELSNRRILYRWKKALGEGVPDGLKVDSIGNIWATGPGGVSIISPQGKILGRIVLPEVVANLAFADDGKTVYLTATSSVYRLGTKVPGQIPLYYRR